MALIVKIYINETCIIDVHVCRVEGTPPGICTYEMAGGETIRHRYSDGAEALAIKLLKCVQKNREYQSRIS